ncbi:MAG TPA: acetyl-CoA carboxylase biotin carboxyl carrier protein subunit [Acidimicrobiaceae bacterium]|nr:acetyl-CoA carboxylase biotin carboxyl carrier protein subunit [Acidimicrobiaceae bacterium]
MSRIELESPVTGVVWRVATVPGDRVSAGDTVIVVESMKMEIPVEACADGTITQLLVNEGDSVVEDELVAILQTD